MILFRPCSLLATLCLFLTPSSWGTASPASPSEASLQGYWVTKGYESVVEIGPCPDAPSRLCGDIVWLWDAVDAAGHPVRDAENPDSTLRPQPLLGRTIVIDMVPKASNTHSASGHIYNPGDGRTYRATIALIDPTTLHVEGCVMFICQTQVWRRPTALPRFDARNS